MSKFIGGFAKTFESNYGCVLLTKLYRYRDDSYEILQQVRTEDGSTIVVIGFDSELEADEFFNAYSSVAAVAFLSGMIRTPIGEVD